MAKEERLGAKEELALTVDDFDIEDFFGEGGDIIEEEVVTTEVVKEKAVKPDEVVTKETRTVSRTTRRRVVSLVGEEAKSIVQDMFLIFQDGRLMESIHPTGVPALDEDTLHNLITALQDFIGDSFDEKGGVKTLQREKETIAIERGVQMYLAVVFEGPEPEKLHQKMRYALIDIYDNNRKAVKTWATAQQELQNVQKCLKPVQELFEE